MLQTVPGGTGEDEQLTDANSLALGTFQNVFCGRNRYINLVRVSVSTLLRMEPLILRAVAFT